MALVKCMKCGKIVPDKTNECIYCKASIFNEKDLYACIVCGADGSYINYNEEIQKYQCDKCKSKYNSIDELKQFNKETQKEKNQNIERSKKKAQILTTTGYNFQGYTIYQYVGVESGEVVLGTGFLSEINASFNDLFGFASDAFEDKIDRARSAALDKLLSKALYRAANAIIGIDFDYVIFSGNLLGVIATGTLVKIQKEDGNNV